MASSVEIEVLRGFSPLGRLSDEQLVLLSSRVTVRQVAAGGTVLEAGSRDNQAYFLLSGELLLHGVDGQQLKIAGGTPEGRKPIAPVQPRQCLVTAVVDSQLIVVDLFSLARLLKEAPVSGQEAAEPDESDVESPTYSLLMRFYQDLKANRVSMPSLPDVAIRIHRVAEEKHSSAADVAKELNQDPAMVVKLLRAANSPLYRGWSVIETSEEAIVRLGIHTTRQLITIFAMRELFRTRAPHLQERMLKLWQHSREVAAISFVLAKMTPGLRPEQAMLAGLIHEVGAIPIIQYAEKELSLVKYPELLEEAIQELREEIGTALLEQWGLSSELVNVVRHADDYLHDTGSDKPTYLDVVLLARLHAAIGKPGKESLPQMESVPAFRKLALGELSAGRSLKVLTQAQEELAAARSIVGTL